MDRSLCIFSSFSFLVLIALILPAQELPSDKKATKETINLYSNLKKLIQKGFMFGHQDDLAYGVGWKCNASASSAGRSDIKDRYASKEDYLEKYPGDEWVDIIGFDIYQRNNANDKFITDIDKMLSTLKDIAKEKNKIPALTEFGGNMADTNWWTGTFLKGIGNHKYPMF